MKASRIVRFLQAPYFLYCAHAWQRAAALTALRIPITCPPVVASTFEPRWMEGRRVLIFKLHGYPGRPNWHGVDKWGNRMTALTPDLVRSADLTGVIVIAIVCNGLGGEMEQAFLDAGARAIFGSSKEVRARETEPGEADLLAKMLLQSLARSPQDLGVALAKAKEKYAHRPDQTLHDRWTLEHWNITEGAA